jgi:peroxiredoxin
MRTVFRLRTTAVLSALLICVSQAAAQGGSTVKPVTPVGMGQTFPAGTFTDLNQPAGTKVQVDLASVIGDKPVVLYYWIAGNDRADQIFLELQALVDELGETKPVLYGVAIQRPGRDASVIRPHLEKMGIRVPVLDDEGFVIGQRLRVQTVPNITLIDVEGRLRLTNGASLLQVLGYQLDLAGAIRRMGVDGSVGTYGYLPAYYPVKELVGQQCPDFKAPLLSNSVEQRWSSMLNPEKVNILIFWSVDCPHCRKSLPEINAWLKANGEGLNVISAATVTNEESKQKTRQFCDLNGFVFPTLMDQDLEISNLYQVTSTPTILIIRPDGVVDSAMTSSNQEFGATVEKKRRELLDKG